MGNELSLKKNLVIICGHYKGIDERIRENLITREKNEENQDEEIDL